MSYAVVKPREPFTTLTSKLKIGGSKPPTATRQLRDVDSTKTLLSTILGNTKKVPLSLVSSISKDVYRNKTNDNTINSEKPVSTSTTQNKSIPIPKPYKYSRGRRTPATPTTQNVKQSTPSSLWSTVFKTASVALPVIGLIAGIIYAYKSGVQIPADISLPNTPSTDTLVDMIDIVLPNTETMVDILANQNKLTPTATSTTTPTTYTSLVDKFVPYARLLPLAILIKLLYDFQYATYNEINEWLRRNPRFPESNQTECVICAEEFKNDSDNVFLSCYPVQGQAYGHRFHSKCIIPWLRLNAICPSCRKPQDEFKPEWRSRRRN